MAPSNFKLPTIYSVFFLIIEPISALVGAYYAFFQQQDYLLMTHHDSSLTPVAQSTSIVLSQLANLYLLFALNEALVLRSTSNITVWKTVLIGLLIADFGHLYSVRSLGPDIYYKVWTWNAMHAGNVGFVYIGACMRIAFLSGIGMHSGQAGKKKAR